MTQAPSKDADWLYRRLGWKIRDGALLEVALTHRSAAGVHNERLEFLGDAVLSFLVAEWLYRRFPQADEGDLTRFRASLVNGESLADIGERLALGERLRLGSGELRSGGFRRRSILADAFEAVLGAVYLDGGIEAARAAVEPLLAEKLSELQQHPVLKDPKTQLQEYLQGKGLPLPIYTIDAISGEAHEQFFTVSCTLGTDSAVCEGTGSSRRRAEQVAASRLLKILTDKGEM